MPTIAMFRTKRPICCSNGERVSVIAVIEVPILPKADAAPTWVMRTTANPPTACVPRNTSLFFPPSVSLWTENGSPVRIDSFTAKSLACTTSPSAGSSSPSFTTT